MEYTVRRMRPEDAAGITALVRSVYGDSYRIIHPEVYEPDRIIRLNQTEELVSVVALAGAGQVVGHYALERPDLGMVAESGEAMVAPEHRHHHLLEQMRDVLEAEAHRLSLIGIYGRAVTNHVFSQRAIAHAGARPCALSLGPTPASFHNMAEPLQQRLSLMLFFKFLRRPTSVAGHVPEHHQDICARIYEQHDVRVEFRPPSAPAKAGEITVDYRPELQAAWVRVRRAGIDTAGELRQIRRDLIGGRGAEVVFLELPVAQAAAPELCRAAEDDGFFFSGLGPCFAPDGDVLRLQFLNVELDPDLVLVDHPFALELKTYVLRERERVGRAAANRQGLPSPPGTLP